MLLFSTPRPGDGVYAIARRLSAGSIGDNEVRRKSYKRGTPRKSEKES